MQVILRERFGTLGGPGDVVEVKPGYGRNFLIPKGLAYEATDANVRRLERERARVGQIEAESLSEARARSASIESASVTFNVRAGEEGRLFGSITSSDIADKLAEQGIEVDRKDILLDEPIKSLGVTAVPIKLHTDVRPELKVWVVKED
ncbi:MAG TPA: 50S ribosomal protein L9 [Longimicrobiaceae bacterium]|nr:50S ribosomal protein L9 [Longimicrobiaceae bacterium]